MARFCRNRLCQMCQWRRSVLLRGQLCEVVDEHLERRPTDRALMLTLTMQNCAPEALNATISQMTTAFRRLSEFSPVKRAVVGWFRSLEVTRRAKDGTYHPHLHVLLMVPGEYFSKSTSLYLRTDQWVQLWRKALRVNYDPVADVRPIGKRGGQSMEEGLLEVTKYCTKPDNWITFVGGADAYHVEPETVAELALGLKHKRLIGWGGTLRDIFAELGLEDVEDDEADLVGTVKVPAGWEFVAWEDYGFWRSPHGVPGCYYLYAVTTGPPAEATGPPGEAMAAAA